MDENLKKLPIFKIDISKPEYEAINNFNLLIFHDILNQEINHLDKCIIEFKTDNNLKISFIATHYKILADDLFNGLQNSFSILNKNTNKNELRIILANKFILTKDNEKISQYHLLNKIDNICEENKEK